MPITSSEITEDSAQADGTRRVTESHTAGSGTVLTVSYNCPSGFDATQAMNDRVAFIDRQLIEQEIDLYLDRIERGLNVIGLPYTETNMAERAWRFIDWAKDCIRQKDNQKIRYAYLVTEGFTAAQIDGLLGMGMGVKVKAWEIKIKLVDEAMDASEAEGGVI